MLEVNILDEKWYSIAEYPESFVIHIINTSLKELKIAHYKPSISIALANDDFLHQLNLKFRKIDKPTNVLSFPCEELFNESDLGDIAISVDTIKRESNEYCIPILSHVAHMLIHGLLHLLGYDHETQNEEAIMKDLENRLLAKFNL